MGRVEGIQTLVRPLVTLVLTAGLLGGFLTGKIGAEAYLSVNSVVIGFWFSQRQQKSDAEPPPSS